MSLVVNENGGGSGIPILPEGSYTAVCYMLVDLGLQKSEKYGNSQRKVLIGWELTDEYIEIDGKQQPRVFSQRYTASLNEKAGLRRDLAAWRGRDFTADELKAFDLHNIVGAPCFIQVIHREGTNGKTYANLASIMRLPKGMPTPQGTMEQVIFDIDESPMSDIDKLPEWIANNIKGSESWKERVAREAPPPSLATVEAMAKQFAQQDNGEGFTELSDADVYGEGVLPF